MSSERFISEKDGFVCAERNPLEHSRVTFSLPQAEKRPIKKPTPQAEIRQKNHTRIHAQFVAGGLGVGGPKLRFTKDVISSLRADGGLSKVHVHVYTCTFMCTCIAHGM